MKLSDCKTLEDLAKFVPTNPEGWYFDENGQSYHVNTVDFVVSKDKDSFLALPRGFMYGYGEPLNVEFFNDNKEAYTYMVKKNFEKNKKRIKELKDELARLENEVENNR